MNRYLIIGKLRNSFGTGYYIRAETPNAYFPEQQFYGYSLRDAVKLYRARYGLRGLHFQTVLA
jgi:hypothetical protein